MVYDLRMINNNGMMHKVFVKSLIVLFGVGNFLTFVDAGPNLEQSQSIIFYLKHTFEVSFENYEKL